MGFTRVKGPLRGLTDSGDGARAGVLSGTGVRGFAGGKGGGVFAGGDLDGDARLTSWVSVMRITDTVNKELGLRGERIRLRPEHVGHILTVLDLTNRERTNRGVRLWLDLARRRIHQNAKIYGQDELGLYYGPQLEECPLCGENSLAELLNKVPSAPESESTKSSDPAQNTSPAGSPKPNGIDNVARAVKTCRRRNHAHSQQASRSKRRARAKR